MEAYETAGMESMKTSLLCWILFPALVWAQYPIGHRNMSFVDSSRANRPVPTDVYYPAASAGDYTPVAVPTAGGFPVISFGHGFLLNVATYRYVWEALVPHGYIVALPRTEGSLSPSHQQFGLDLAFLIRTLQAEGSDNSSPFFNAIGNASCVMGHSMGGGASFLAAQSDSSITALVNLAAAETNPSAIDAAGVLIIPAMLFSGSEDCVTPPSSHQLPMYQALASQCKIHISITGGSHCKFGENNFTCNLGEIGCPGSITRPVQHNLVIFHLLPFLDFHLKQESTERCVFQERLEAQNGISYLQECVVPAVQDLTIQKSPNGVTLQWSPVFGGCTYDLLRSTEAVFEYDTLLRIYSGPAFSFEDTISGERASYQVWVK